VGVVAQPWRRAETLFYSGSCVAPLRLGGLRGKQSTPSVWLGGTGEHSAVGKRERQGAWDCDSRCEHHTRRAQGIRYAC
jgi:hypothetical protein